MQTEDSIVYGQIVLISSSGSELLKKQKITSKNIHSLLPSAETVNKASLRLQQLGFSVNVQGVSISISGQKKNLKKSFPSN